MSEVRQVGIVGGGFVGSGIAESVARAGIAAGSRR
jgi:3-hydroxyacyl-CoA dehydrogenase